MCRIISNQLLLIVLIPPPPLQFWWRVLFTVNWSRIIKPLWRVICVFGFYFEEVREITVHLRLDLWFLCAKYETHIILENKLPGKDNIMDCWRGNAGIGVVVKCRRAKQGSECGIWIEVTPNIGFVFDAGGRCVFSLISSLYLMQCC